MSLFENIDIKSGDKVLVSSNLLKILISKRKSKNFFSPDTILNELITKIGPDGTLLIPTYNWDFCKGKDFCYHKTLSLSGSLGNFALKRNDFLRTQNPIYSFAVTGKDKDKLFNFKHKSCFGLDSPFGYLINSEGKNLFIDLDYKEGFTLCHVAEESVGVNYRYLKKFSGQCKNHDGRIENKEFSMYVRDPKSNVMMTSIHSDFDKALSKLNAIKNYQKKDFSLQIINIKKAYNLMVDDLKNKTGLIYGKKS